MERREFLNKAIGGLALLPCAAASNMLAGNAYAKGIEERSRVTKLALEARHYEKLPGKKVKCRLCPRECVVADLERGYCGVRENQDGIYYSLVYGSPCSLAVDPVEKKPLFHYRPGSMIFSLATAGCNIECKFCQNWEISQKRPEQIESVELAPSGVVDQCLKNGAKNIAFTYTEPVVCEEYVYDTALSGKCKGVSTVIISNGYLQKKPLEELLKVLKAVKIDLKGFTDKFYRETCSGELNPVLESIKLIAKSPVWLELVVLIIPGLNDSASEIDSMTKWVVSNVGRSVPIHFTRFHPMYKLKDVPSTPVSTLNRCREIALKNGLDFVYVGNVPGHDGEHTYCPKCKKKIIERYGFFISSNRIKDGKCGFCGKTIPGVWS